MTRLPTKPSTRKLSDVARHVVIPTGIVSTGWPPVESRLEEFGILFDDWQRSLGMIILGKRVDGMYAATVGGVTLSLPRQVAKTFIVSRIVFALCTLFPGLTVLWTAHRTRTTTNTFQKLRGFTELRKVAPFMHPRTPIRSTNGEQEIHFANGSVIMFGAREGGFGRGFDEVDIEVFDEAQILTERALDDMIAATNQSRFASGALLFFMGTPPRPVDPGEEFKHRRREALAVKTALANGQDAVSNLVYVECSADQNANIDDRKQWAKANPSYPLRTNIVAFERLRAQLSSDDSWRREALGIWDRDAEGSRFIDAGMWERTAVRSISDVGLRAFGVAFSLDGSRVSIAGALKHDTGVHVELIKGYTGDIRNGVGPIAEWLSDRHKDIATIVIAGAAGSATLKQELRDRKVPERVLHVITTQEYLASCALFFDAVSARTVTHPLAGDDDVLEASVASTDKKKRGLNGAWGWVATTPNSDETPLEAVSVAHWAVRTTKRRPNRKQSGMVMT